MRRLLDNSTRRRLELLELLSKTDDWVKSSDLASLLNASLRTINNDIHFIKEHWSDNVVVETSKQKGIRLYTPASGFIQIIYTDILAHSDGFKLLENLFFDPAKNLEEWENKMYVSHSSLYRISQALNNILKPYHLSLKNKPLHIASDNEVIVRSFFANYFNEVHFIREWCFPFNRDLLTQTASILWYQFESKQQTDNRRIVYLTYILAVSLMRHTQGFYTSTESYPVTKEQLHTLRNTPLAQVAAQNNLPFTESLLADIARSIFLFRRHDIRDEDWDKLNDKIKTALDKLAKLLDLTLATEQKQAIQLSLNLLYLDHSNFPYHEAVIFDSYSYNAKNIAKTYPVYARCVASVLDSLEQETNFPWYSIYYLPLLHWIMVKWHKLPRLIDEKKTKVCVLIISDHGLEHAYFVKNLLEIHFEAEAVFTAYNNDTLYPDKLDTNLFQAYDFCISNFYLAQIPKEKALFIHTYPNDEEWAMIRHRISKTYHLPENSSKKMA